jgi:curved DNA-binding protein
MLGEKYYKILGLTGTENDAEVKRKYRELAKKYHPDKNKDENSTRKFQEIKAAYENIINKDFSKEKNSNPPREKTNEEKFHENAWKRAEQQKKQEAADLLVFYKSFRIGWKKRIVKINAIVGCICLIVILADDFLPLRSSIETVEEYIPAPSHSIGNNYVYNAKLKNGPWLWLNYNDNHSLENHPKLYLKKTRILHQPVYAINHSDKIKAKVHFTFYWAQIVIIVFSILPIVLSFYKKNNVFFVLGSYITIALSTTLLLFFLLNDLKIIHLLTIGYY